MQDFGLYIVITNPALGYLKFTEICVAEKVKIIQLREKKLTDRKLLSLARQMRSITHKSQTKFVINDRLDIAMLCDADGLHLGQDDLPWWEIRALWPKLLGVSTHSMDQAKAVLQAPLLPDYMSFGPIYPTSAKENPDPPLGTAQLTEIAKLQKCPILAIGGIFEQNLKSITTCNIKNVAMIRQFCELDDPHKLRTKIRHIKQALEEEK